jgi:excisionase family DNA binding protein
LPLKFVPVVQIRLVSRKHRSWLVRRMTIFDTPADNPRRLLTTDEVVSYLRVNARTVYRLIQSGDLPAVRVGRQWRIRRNDLNEWLERGRPVAASGPKTSES